MTLLKSILNYFSKLDLNDIFSDAVNLPFGSLTD